MKRWCSIDCGLKGGMAFWINEEIKQVAPMPAKKGALDMPTILEYLQDVDMVIIEEQFNPHAKNQKGGKTNLLNFGKIVGVAEALNKMVYIQNASQWVTALGLSNRGRSPLLPKLTKKDRARKANRLYNLNLKDNEDGIADSILIGHYVLKKGIIR